MYGQLTSLRDAVKRHEEYDDAPSMDSVLDYAHQCTEQVGTLKALLSDADAALDPEVEYDGNDDEIAALRDALQTLMGGVERLVGDDKGY